jgi:hypothetical protein
MIWFDNRFAAPWSMLIPIYCSGNLTLCRFHGFSSTSSKWIVRTDRATEWFTWGTIRVFFVSSAGTEANQPRLFFFGE